MTSRHDRRGETRLVSKLAEIRAGLIESGCDTIAKQAKAFGLGRSTTWAMFNQGTRCGPFPPRSSNAFFHHRRFRSERDDKLKNTSKRRAAACMVKASRGRVPSTMGIQKRLKRHAASNGSNISPVR